MKAAPGPLSHENISRRSFVKEAGAVELNPRRGWRERDCEGHNEDVEERMGKGNEEDDDEDSDEEEKDN